MLAPSNSDVNVMADSGERWTRVAEMGSTVLMALGFGGERVREPKHPAQTPGCVGGGDEEALEGRHTWPAAMAWAVGVQPKSALPGFDDTTWFVLIWFGLFGFSLSGFGVWGLGGGLGVHSGFRLWALGFGVSGLGLGVKRYRGGLVLKAHRLVYHSTLGWRAIKREREGWGWTLVRAAPGGAETSEIEIASCWCSPSACLQPTG